MIYNNYDKTMRTCFRTMASLQTPETKRAARAASLGLRGGRVQTEHQTHTQNSIQSYTVSTGL